MMKTTKQTITCLLGALLCFAVLILLSPAALADCNLLESGSVQYMYVESAEALRHRIDHDGVCSVQEEIDEKTAYSNVYKIILDEPGQLVICPLAKYRASQTDNMYFSLYADFSLQGEIIKSKTFTSDRETMLSQNVDAGTYYFRFSQRYAQNALLTVYIGFIPSSGNMRQDTVTAEATEKSGMTYQDVHFVYTVNDSYFANQIDNDLAALSIHMLNGDKSSEYMQFTVEEPGTVLIAPLCSQNSSCFELYSDAVLTSKVGMIEGLENTREKFLSVKVEPGTYYYRCYNRYSSDYSRMMVYIGFIPDSFATRMDSFVKADGRASTEIVPMEIGSINDFEAFINTSKPTFSSTITQDSSADLYRFTANESGMLYLASTSVDADDGVIRLYSNLETSSRLLNERISHGQEVKIHGICLEPGTYYITAHKKYNGTKNQTTYLGFIPTSRIIAIDAVETDQEKAIVRFHIAEEYNPDLSRSIVRVVPGYIHARYLMSKDLWKDETRENAIESHSFTATKNGTYTVRILGNNLEPFMFTFEIQGIGGNTNP